MRGKIRNSNIEILRIIAILMVIALHWLNETMGGVLASVSKDSLNHYVANTIESFSIIAVNLFVLSSSWFLLESKKVRISKIIRLVGIAYIYGMIFYIIAIGINREAFKFTEFIEAINVFLSGRYWFIGIYSILYLIHPYLNVLIKNLSRQKYKGLLIILLFVFSIWPSFLEKAPNNDNGYGIISFINLYLTIGYVKKYKIEFKKEILVYIVCGSITTICSLLNIFEFWNYNFVFNIIGAVNLFILFTKIKIENKSINKVSKFTFPVYIIHSNQVVISIVYFKIMDIDRYYNSKLFIINMIVGILVIYIVSIIIEILRLICIKGFNKTFSKLKEKYVRTEMKIDEKFYEKFYRDEECEKIISQKNLV